MVEKQNKIFFTRILPENLTVWMLGGIIFWLMELIFVLIGLPQSWDYKFLRDGMPVPQVLSLTLLPEKISTALLTYILISVLGGLICFSVLYLILRKSSEIKLKAASISVFLVSSFFVYSGFWLNTKYLPGFFTVTSIFTNSIFVLLCLLLIYLCFKLFVKNSDARLFSGFIALVFSLDCFMFGELLLLKSFSAKLLSIKGAFLSLGLIVACVFLFLALRFICRLKLFQKITLQTAKKWVFMISAVLVFLAGICIVIREGRVASILNKQKESDGDKPNVVLIVMDTARADRFSCYGYGRPTTPHIDQIAEEGVLFERAISPSRWTLPSHASIFTGLFLSEHGAGHGYSFLSREFDTLAEILKEEGYKTLAYSNNPWVSFFTGLNPGFDDFQEGWKLKVDRYFYEVVYSKLLIFVKRNDPSWSVKDRGAAKTTRYVSEWIKKNRRKPFFVFINYMEPHLPYDPPAPYNLKYQDKTVTAEDIAQFSPDPLNIRDFIWERERSPKERSVIDALYDGEMNYLDGKIGELFESIKEQNLHDRTLLIITSDHGENLGEHGIVGHAFGLFNTLIEVNLIIRHPKYFQAGMRIKDYVQTPDIFYTILDAVGIERNPSELGLGKSLIQRIEENDYQEIILAEHDLPTNVIRWARKNGIEHDHIIKDQKTVISDGYKYIKTSQGEEMLYNLDEDPGESINLLEERPKTASILQDKLTELEKKVKPFVSTEKKPQMDKETKEKLKSLGYVK